MRLTVTSTEESASDIVHITIQPDRGLGLDYLLYYTIRPHRNQKTQIDRHIDELMAMGFTHVTLQDPFANDLPWVNEIRAKGYRIAMSFNPRAYPDDLVTGTDSNKYHLVNASQFPDYPNCPNSATNCPISESTVSLCPGYNKILWQNSLNLLRTRTQALQPDVVLIDAEYFTIYSRIESYHFPGVISACSRCQGELGYENNRRERGRDMVNAVKSVAPNAIVILHHTHWPDEASQCFRGDGDPNGIIRTNNSNWWPVGVGDIPSPEQYGVPDTGLMECNALNVNVVGAVPAMSFSYGAHGATQWAPSLSFQMGQLYKTGGVRGLIIWPSWFPDFVNEQSWIYWRDHAQSLINGLRSIP